MLGILAKELAHFERMCAICGSLRQESRLS